MMKPRQLLLSAFLLISGAISAVTNAQALVDDGKSPHIRLKSVDFTSVQWTKGFWGDRFRMIQEDTLAHLGQLAESSGAIRNLEIAAGLKTGSYSGGGNNWMDAWVYKWIEAAAAVYAVSRDAQLDRRMDALISIIAQAQESDGYIASQNTVRQRPRFQEPQHHEVYVMGHLLSAACIHHRLVGKSNLLNVARRTGDFLHQAYKGKNPKLAHFPLNPSVVMGAVDLYRVTREPRYLELANTVIDMRGAFAGGSDLNQDRIPLRKEKEVVGHAVFYTYLYAGAADAYMETGDTQLLSTLERLWQDLTDHKLYITGGTCALYRGLSIRQGNTYGADIVHEAVGAPYHLPKTPAYNETCGQVGHFMWNSRMLAISGQARYADMMERQMYNGFLPGIGIEGKDFVYTNPLRWHGHEQELWAQDSLVRHQPAAPKPHQPGSHFGTCCPSNVLRTLAEMQHYFYSVNGKDLWIHQYGGNKFNNSAYRLEQRTDYPWKGQVDITVQQAPSDGTIHLRIPAWAKGYSLHINQKPVNTQGQTGTHVKLQRVWASGDKIKLHLPLKVRMMRAHRKVDATHNQVALQRGPLVYCLESTDLPQGVDVAEILIPRDAQLIPRWEPDFLAGVVTLNGRARHLPKDDSGLYTELRAQTLEDIDVKLIPYYAWKNRGVSQMTVWLPIDW